MDIKATDKLSYLVAELTRVRDEYAAQLKTIDENAKKKKAGPLRWAELAGSGTELIELYSGFQVCAEMLDNVTQLKSQGATAGMSDDDVWALVASLSLSKLVSAGIRVDTASTSKTANIARAARVAALSRIARDVESVAR